MSIGGISNNSTNYLRQAADRRPTPSAQASPVTPDDSQDNATSGSAPTRNNFFGMAGNITDEVKVNLPNGLSIGMAHFGSPLDAAGQDEMVKSMAELAKSFGTIADQPGSAQSADTTDATQAAGGQQDGNEDQVHVDMPNGVSFDIMHWSQANETDEQQKAIDDQLTKAATALADALKAYLDASPAKAGATGAAGSAANGSAESSPSHDVSA